MSFQIPCANCGPRSFEEFMFLGELRDGVSDAETDVLEDFERTWWRTNAVEQSERWFHIDGCKRVVRVTRNTRTQHVASDL